MLHESWAESSSALAFSLPGRPNIRRLRSIEPTATYCASGPNFTHVALPASIRGLQLGTLSLCDYWRSSVRDFTSAGEIWECLDKVPFSFHTRRLVYSAAKTQIDFVELDKPNMHVIALRLFEHFLYLSLDALSNYFQMCTHLISDAAIPR